MNLALQNVGKVKSAELLLNGITVLVGDNNAGKSTMGKSLYAAFNSLYHIDEVVDEQRFREIRLSLRFAFGRYRSTYAQMRNVERIIDEIKFGHDWKRVVREFMFSLAPWSASVETVEELIKTIDDILNLNDEQVRFRIVKNYFDRVFSDHFIAIDSREGTVSLVIAGDSVRVGISRDAIVDLSAEVNIQHRAFLVEDSKVLNCWNGSRYSAGSNILNESIRHAVDESRRGRDEASPSDTAIKDVMQGSVYDQLLEDLKKVILGQFVFDDRDVLRYSDEQMGIRDLDLGVVSEGVKSFGVLGLLLSTRAIGKKDVLILDEPEVHLHPAWQLLYAEFIVKLQEKLDLTVLLTTHSPSFLFALQLYARKHNRAKYMNSYRIRPSQEDYRFSEVSAVKDGLCDLDEALVSFAGASNELSRLIAEVNDMELAGENDGRERFE